MNFLFKVFFSHCEYALGDFTSTYFRIDKVSAEVDTRKGTLAVCAISFAVVAARVVYPMRLLNFVEGCIRGMFKI
jgi:hypothetical protein